MTGSERVADAQGGREQAVVGGGVDDSGGAGAFAAELDRLQVNHGGELDGPGPAETGNEVEPGAVAEVAVGVAGVGGVLADEERQREVGRGADPEAVGEQDPLQAGFGLRAGDGPVDEQGRALDLDRLAHAARAEAEVGRAGGRAGSEVTTKARAEADLVQVVFEGADVVGEVELDARPDVEGCVEAERFLGPDLDPQGDDRQRGDRGVDGRGGVAELEAPVEHPGAGPDAGADPAAREHRGVVGGASREGDGDEQQGTHRAIVSRMCVACIGVTLALGWAGPTHARTPTPAERQIEAAVHRHLSVFLTTRDRREESERVALDGDRLEVWFMRPLPRANRAEALCDGFRWIIRGRLAGSTGIQALFAALPEIESVTLVFYELETKVQPDAEGRYTQLREASARARYTVTRQRAGMVDPVAAARALEGDGCASRGEALVDGFWAAPEGS